MEEEMKYWLLKAYILGEKKKRENLRWKIPDAYNWGSSLLK